MLCSHLSPSSLLFGPSLQNQGVQQQQNWSSPAAITACQQRKGVTRWLGQLAHVILTLPDVLQDHEMLCQTQVKILVPLQFPDPCSFPADSTDHLPVPMYSFLPVIGQREMIQWHRQCWVVFSRGQKGLHCSYCSAINLSSILKYSGPTLRCLSDYSTL